MGNPQIIHLFIGFGTIIFTIHFGVPLLLETSICYNCWNLWVRNDHHSHFLGWFKLPDLANHMWRVSLLTKEENANLQIWPPFERQSWRNKTQTTDKSIVLNLLSPPAKRHSCHLTRITTPIEPHHTNTKRQSRLRSNTYWKAPMQWRNVLSIALASHVEHDSVPSSFLRCLLRYDPEGWKRVYVLILW